MWNIIITILIIVTVGFVFKDTLYKWVKFVEYYCKVIMCYFILIFVLLILLPIFLWNGKNLKNSVILAHSFQFVPNLLNIKFHLRSFEIVSEDRGAVVLLNHQSSLDLLSLCILWLSLGKAVCVSKKELIYYFPLGLAIYLTDVIFIDRSSPKDAHKVLQMKAKKFLDNKTKIVIFPEGTRSKDFTKLLPFKKGAFNVAVGAQVPIIPVVISRYYFKNDKKHILNGGHVIAQCLDPVSTEGLTMDDVPELIERVHSDMDRVFKELSKEVICSLPPDYPLETLN